MAQSQCRPCEPRPVEGDVGDRELPHGGARRACRALRGLLAHADRLQLLPQPSLPEVPGRRRQGMARRARGRVVAGAVLSRRVHAAGADQRHRLPEQGRHLRHPVQGLGRGADHDRRRSKAPRRARRRHLRAAQLGLGDDASPARAHDRAGRRHLARRGALGVVPARLLPAGARPLAPVPPAVPGEAHRSTQTGRLSSSASTLRSPRHRRSRPIWRRCAEPNGSSTQSVRSAGPRRCSPICRATPTVSPSPTAG